MAPDDPPAAAEDPRYTIRGGRTDADRLARQARVMAEGTDAFLLRTGLAEGWACLDVGCGDGQVTIHMARVAGPDGRALGTDIDEGALDIARESARRANVTAEFRALDASEAPERDTFDLAFARLLLSHVADSEAVLRAMVAAVRTGGAVAIEDLFTGTLRSEPPAPALDRLQDVYSATVRAHGGDPTIGPRLPSLLTAAGLEHVHEATVANRMETTDEKIFLAELVDNMRDSMLKSGVASATELDEIRAGVAEAANDPERVFFQARMHQVWGRRPT